MKDWQHRSKGQELFIKAIIQNKLENNLKSEVGKEITEDFMERVRLTITETLKGLGLDDE